MARHKHALKPTDLDVMHGKALHFFPGVKRLLWVVEGRVLRRIEAWGGRLPLPGDDPKQMRYQRTTAGIFTIAGMEAYATNSWYTSKIPWGAPLRMNPHNGYAEVQLASPRGGMHWVRTTSKDARLDAGTLQLWYHILYGESGKYSPVSDLPNKWVFNDFGTVALRYFKDANRNGKLDRGEHLSGEMLHATRDNEAQAALADMGRRVNFFFVNSHGCIHVHPHERDALYKAGAFEPGGLIVVHRYDDPLPEAWQP